tara:strand:+ start:407 stop:730 length:324 start_codon:yes stop_codon:yes gene_type:complete
MQFAGEVDATEVPVEGPGVTHLCLQSPAKNVLFDKFIKHKAKSVSSCNPPIDLNEAGEGVCYGYVRDADNIMFEIEQLDKPNFKSPGWIAHIALEDRSYNRAFRSKV